MNLRDVPPGSDTGLTGNLEPRDGETRFSYGLRIAGELVTEARKAGGKDTWIYFVQEDCADGAIKVGVTANPLTRIADLQTGNSSRLILRGLFRGPAALERVIHRTFAEERLAGEWFAAVESLEILADTLHYFTTTDKKASGVLFDEPWGFPLLMEAKSA